ncbi:MAG: beta strand repeat-containing protein [Janthinobacterium lividum]
MSGSVTTTLSAQDQTFLLNDTENKYAEAQIDSSATVTAASATVSELGRWFGVDYGRLIATDLAVAKTYSVQSPSGPGTAQVALITQLGSLTGTAFDTQYLADVITLKQQDIAGASTEISSGANPTAIQVAMASNSLVTEHLAETQYVQAALAGTALPAVPNSMPIAGPPLAPTTSSNDVDQTFVTNAIQGGLTAMQEGMMAASATTSPDLSLQMYGYWTRCENAQAGANITAIAQALNAASAAGTSATGTGSVTGTLVIPTTITSAQAIQVSTLGSFTGTIFEATFAADQVSNDQALVAAIKAEIAGGSDTAMTTLAQAILAPAQALLTQAVIESVQVGGGFTDATLAPTTLAGQVVQQIATAAGAGALTIGNLSIGPATLASGAAGVLLVDVAGSTVVAPTGYADILDIAGPATISAAAMTANTVVGSTSGVTYYGATGASGLLLLDGGPSLVVGASTGGGNYTIVGSNAGSNTIFAGSGTNQIATGAGASLVGLGSGANTVTLQGTDTVLGSTGNDVVYGSGTSQAIFAGSGSLIFVGGAGAATIVTGATKPVVAFGASGGSVNLFGASSGNVLAASAGNETLQGANGTGANIFFGGTGTSALVGGTGNDLFIAGKGASVITGGTGANTFEFVSGATGGATDFISDFGASAANRVQLSGYGSTTAAVLNTATVSGGSTTITLADNTKVQFVGVTNLSSTSFL